MRLNPPDAAFLSMTNGTEPDYFINRVPVETKNLVARNREEQQIPAADNK